MKRSSTREPKGIIIGGWKPEEYTLAPGKKVQVYIRSTEDGPPVSDLNRDYGETHWIRAEDHRKIMEEARQHYMDNVMIMVRNQIAKALMMEEIRYKTTEDEACL